MSDWTSVATLSGIPDGKGVRVAFGDSTVLLVRSGERVHAIGNRCTHQGASLDRGPVKVGGSLATVTCPAHGSIFGLEDGRVLRGPATKPVGSYDVRITEGSVEIRPRS